MEMKCGPMRPSSNWQAFDGCSPGDMEDTAMATILPFLKYESVFDPKDIQAMSIALDDVCKSLNLREGPAREVVAGRIVNLARQGVRSSTVLRDRVLHEVVGQARTSLDGRDSLTA